MHRDQFRQTTRVALPYGPDLPHTGLSVQLPADDRCLGPCGGDREFGQDRTGLIAQGGGEPGRAKGARRRRGRIHAHDAQHGSGIGVKSIEFHPDAALIELHSSGGRLVVEHEVRGRQCPQVRVRYQRRHVERRLALGSKRHHGRLQRRVLSGNKSHTHSSELCHDRALSVSLAGPPRLDRPPRSSRHP